MPLSAYSNLLRDIKLLAVMVLMMPCSMMMAIELLAMASTKTNLI